MSELTSNLLFVTCVGTIAFGLYIFWRKSVSALFTGKIVEGVIIPKSIAERLDKSYWLVFGKFGQRGKKRNSFDELRIDVSKAGVVKPEGIDLSYFTIKGSSLRSKVKLPPEAYPSEMERVRFENGWTKKDPDRESHPRNRARKFLEGTYALLGTDRDAWLMVAKYLGKDIVFFSSQGDPLTDDYLMMFGAWLNGEYFPTWKKRLRELKSL